MQPLAVLGAEWEDWTELYHKGVGIICLGCVRTLSVSEQRLARAVRVSFVRSGTETREEDPYPACEILHCTVVTECNRHCHSTQVDGVGQLSPAPRTDTIKHALRQDG